MMNQNLIENRKSKINAFLKVNHLDASTRKKVSRDLYKLGDYHDGIPMDKIRPIFEKHGLILIDQEDNTEYGAIFCGREGTAKIAFGYKFTSKLVNGIPTYIPFDNSLLILNWYKMNTKHEINLYLS
jgi:hypothetical protein